MIARWFLNAHFAAIKIFETKEITHQLLQTNKKHNKLYLEKIEIQEVIKEVQSKINCLLECIEICEKNIKKSKSIVKNDDFEIDVLRSELCNCENILKKCRGQKELVIEETPVSILVDSLFVSQCYSPDPRVLEYKKYSEDSFEMPNQRNYNNGNTLENTLTEPSDNKKNMLQRSLKKKCCGLIN